MRVRFQDAYDELVTRSAHAASWVKWWRRNYSDIVDDVTNFAHESLFEVSSSDVVSTLERGLHALGDVRSESQIKVVEDLDMPHVAVQDLFHRFLEQEKALPTWPEFRAYLHEPDIKPAFLDLWWRALRPHLRGYSRERIEMALQWRLGKMYYSNMREIDMLARMREKHDLHLKYHIFGDVRLRTDFWVGNTNISVFLSNPLYRGDGSARKKKAEKFFADAQPAFRFLEVEFPNLRDFGNLYRVPQERLDRLAAEIRAR